MVDKVTILIAQSNDRIRHSLGIEFLNYPDIEVVGSTMDGEKVLKLLEKFQPDILLMDIILTKVDGLSVLEELKAKNKDYKTLIYSAISNETVINKATALGANHYMVKTLNSVKTDVKNLIKQIEKILNTDKIKISKINKESIFEKKGILKTKEELIEEICSTLHKGGIPPHIKGYKYLTMCIYEGTVNPKILKVITKELYLKVADFYDTSPSGVERAMRHSLEVAWAMGNISEMFEAEGIIYKDQVVKPTCKEFIILISENLRNKN